MAELLEKYQFLVAIKTDPRVKCSGHRVAAGFLERYNEKYGFAWPGNDYLAEILDMKERTVRDGVRNLRETEWFFIDKICGVGRWRRAVPNWKKATEKRRLFENRVQKLAKEGAEKRQNRGQENDPYTTLTKPLNKTGPDDTACDVNAAASPAQLEAFRSAMLDAGLGAWADEVELCLNGEADVLEILAPTATIANVIKKGLGQLQEDFAGLAGEAITLCVKNVGIGAADLLKIPPFLQREPEEPHDERGA